jgi:hypothetical protein
MRSTLPIDWNAPEVFRQRLGEGAGRQRIMTASGHLLLVLHQPPAPGAPERSARLFWRDVSGDWRSSSLGDGMQSLRKHLVEFTNQVDELENRWQSASTAEDYYSLLLAIAPLHRTVRHLHAVLQQAREAVPEDRDLLNFRDQAGDIERAIELLHSDAKNGLDFTAAHQSEQQAQQSYDMAVAAHRLNLLVATFFPIATVSAIFSMHLTHGLEEMKHPILFWSILGIALVFGLVLSRVVIARKPAPPKQILAQKTRRGTTRKSR